MSNPEKEHPVADSPAEDTSKLSIEERLDRLEALVGTIAEHQSKLGQHMITVHARMQDMVRDVNEISEDLLDSGVAVAAEANRSERDGNIKQVRPAPLIHPGGHPLRKAGK